MTGEIVKATDNLPTFRSPTFGELQDVARILNGPPEEHRSELQFALGGLETASHQFDFIAEQELAVFNGDSVHIRGADPGNIFVRAYSRYLAHALRLWSDLEEDPASVDSFVRILESKLTKRDEKYLNGNKPQSQPLKPTLEGLFENVGAFDEQTQASLAHVLKKLREEITELHIALSDLPLDEQSLRVYLRRKPRLKEWLANRTPGQTARLEKGDPIIAVLGEIGDIAIIGASIARLFGGITEVQMREAFNEIELQVNKKYETKQAGPLTRPKKTDALPVTA